MLAAFLWSALLAAPGSGGLALVLEPLPPMVRGRLRGQVSDLPWQLRFTPFDPAPEIDQAFALGEARDAGVVIWFQNEADGALRARLLAVDERRLLERRLPRRSDSLRSRSTQAEAAALWVRTSLRMLESGERFGVEVPLPPRTTPRPPAPETAPEPEKRPAEPAPPPEKARPAEPPPAPPRVPDPPEAPPAPTPPPEKKRPWVRVSPDKAPVFAPVEPAGGARLAPARSVRHQLGVGFEGGYDGLWSFGLGAKWAVQVGRFDLGASLLAGLAATSEDARIRLAIARHALRFHAAWAFVDGEPFRATAGALAGAVLYQRSTVTKDPQLLPAPASAQFSPVLGLELRGRWARRYGAEFFLSGEWVPATPDLRIEDQSSLASLRELSGLQVRLGLAFLFLGGS